MDADDELLAQLGAAMRSADEVPASVLAAGEAAFAWRTIDADLAALVHDSLDQVAASGVRDSLNRGNSRMLTFVANELTIELDVTKTGLVGQVILTPQGTVKGTISWEGPQGRSAAADIDDTGWFAIRPVPTGPVRLHLRTASGTAVHTEWITL